MGQHKGRCTHDDCFTCPYDDCISDKEPVKRKAGRKRLDPWEKKRRQRVAQKNYHEANREKIQKYRREYYQKHKSK